MGREYCDKHRKISLLLVIDSLWGAGAELVVCNLCRHLDKEIFDVSVCHLKSQGIRGKELQASGFDVFGLPKSSLKVDYLSFLKLRRAVKDREIDIVHSHSTDSLIDASLCKLTMRGLKTVHTFHFGNYPNYEKKYLTLERIFCRIPDRLVAVGNNQQKAIQKTFNISDSRISTVLNGVVKKEGNTDVVISKRLVQKNRVIIGSISSFVEQKGLTYLLDVALALKRKGRDNIVFLVAGDGPLRNELESKCRRLGIEDMVFFSGWVQNADTQILPLIDIFFQPSLWEAMSMVILEAMSAGKPIVATDVGENGLLIDNGRSGFIVKPRDVEGMISALEKLIHDDILRDRFAAAAKEKYELCGTEEKMIKNYEKIYTEVLN